jgi:hypothetical protein
MKAFWWWSGVALAGIGSGIILHIAGVLAWSISMGTYTIGLLLGLTHKASE